LLVPSARTVRWVSFAVICPTGALIVWSGGHEGGNPAPVALPVATTLLCVWLCFLFEDVAAETTAASATPLLYRRAVRASIAIPSITIAWFAYTWIGMLSGPTVVMLGSFAAMITLTLASSAVAVRMAGAGSGSIVAATAVVFVILVWPVAIQRPPSVDPAHPPFGTPFTYWSAVALLSIAVLAIAHRDRFQRR
jgi:hypothetical protein